MTREQLIMLPMGPGSFPVVRVWTRKTVQFGSRPVQTPDPLLHGGRNLDPYPSTRRICWDLLDIARNGGPNIKCWLSGFATYFHIQISFFSSHNVNFGTLMSISDVLASFIIRNTTASSLMHPKNKSQWRINDF
jgi:hypothetical protein